MCPQWQAPPMTSQTQQTWTLPVFSSTPQSCTPQKCSGLDIKKETDLADKRIRCGEYLKCTPETMILLGLTVTGRTVV